MLKQDHDICGRPRRPTNAVDPLTGWTLVMLVAAIAAVAIALAVLLHDLSPGVDVEAAPAPAAQATDIFSDVAVD